MNSLRRFMAVSISLVGVFCDFLTKRLVNKYSFDEISENNIRICLLPVTRSSNMAGFLYIFLTHLELIKFKPYSSNNRMALRVLTIDCESKLFIASIIVSLPDEVL